MMKVPLDIAMNTGLIMMGLGERKKKMTDIMKCSNEECPRRKDCYRHMAPSSERQSWFSPELKSYDDCHFFMSLPNVKLGRKKDESI